jgi:hypothetical protein
MEGHMSDAAVQRLSGILSELKKLIPTFAAAIEKFDERLTALDGPGLASEPNQDRDYWVAVAYRNALIRLRLILENNFSFLETLGVLATTRYVFETLIWLRQMDRDPDYGLVFYGKVIANQAQHCRDYRAKLEEEITLFEQLQKEESSLHTESLKQFMDSASARRAESVSAATAAVMNEMDRRARRAFSLYAEDAKHNGFGFQAHLMREQATPQINAQIDRFEAEQKAFVEACAPAVRKKLKERWNWKAEARSVGMQAQYDFIYSYTSRLLHATPSSIFTDQKNLEIQEMVMFADYIYVSMLDVIDLAVSQVGPVTRLN